MAPVALLEKLVRTEFSESTKTIQAEFLAKDLPLKLCDASDP